MEALVAITAGRIGRAWLQMIVHLREENPIDAVVARLHTGEPIVGLNAAVAAFAGGEHAEYVRGGQAEARQLRDHFATVVRKKLPVFDSAAPTALAWAERNRLDKIREITTEQRMLIRDALLSAASAGTNPRVAAAEIRDVIGLTAYQQQIVANYRRQLEAGELAAARARELVDGRSDATIAAAIRENRPIPPARIDGMVEAYRQRWIRLRAETIARTEGLRVAHQASDELYRQAVERGDLRVEDLEAKWIHTSRPGKHDRTFHRVMNGQLRRFGEAFVSGRGTLLRFPGDPAAGPEETASCTCVRTVRIRRAA